MIPDSRYYLDPKTLKGCLSNKAKYQERLFKRFYSYAMSICLRYSTNSEDAYEILNDGFMKVFNKINQYDPSKKFTNWLSKIMINTAIDRYRSELRYKYEKESEFPEWIEDETMDAMGQLRVEDILKKVQRLPKLQLMVFNFYEVEGYSHDEIAIMLDLKPSNSRTILSRAKKKLIEIFNKEENFNCHPYV